MLQAVQQWYSEPRSSRPRKGEGGRDLHRQLQYSVRNVTAVALGAGEAYEDFKKGFLRSSCSHRALKSK